MAPDRIVGLIMGCPLSDKRAMDLKGRRLNVHFPGIDDLILVGSGSLDGLARTFLDLPKLEFDFFPGVLFYLHGLRVGLIPDTARLHPIRARPETTPRRLELSVRIGGHGMGSLLDGARGVDHVHHGAAKTPLRPRLVVWAPQPYPGPCIFGARPE